MRAGLLLLDANPLESVANLSKRAGVMVRGRWLPESELRKMLENLATLNARPGSVQTSLALASLSMERTSADYFPLLFTEDS